MIPRTWHYSCSDDELERRLEETYCAWHYAESQLDSAREEYKRTGHKPCDLDTLYRRCKRYRNVADNMEEEICWRDNPQQVIADYASTGYRMMYACHNGLFETWDKAMSEARYIVARNSVLLEYGPDDMGDRDMLKPEDMISVAFVKEENSER